jgi:hypothetical protein
MRACWKRLFYKEPVKNVLLILGTCSAIVCMLWYFHPELTWLEIARIVWKMRDGEGFNVGQNRLEIRKEVVGRAMTATLLIFVVVVDTMIWTFE